MQALARVPGVLAAIDRDRRHGGGLLAGALAYRLFGALLPLSLLFAVLLGYAAAVDSDAPAAAGRAVGLRQALAGSLAESSKLSAGTRWVVAASALFALVFSATAAARAIRAVHTLAWEGGVRRLGRAVPAGLLLVGAVLAFLAVWGLVGSARAHLGVLGYVAAVAAVVPFFAIWLGLSWLLPHADAPWTALIPGAALVALGMQVIHLGTVLFVSGRLERASATYGSFGAAFTVLVWLYLASRIIVGSAMLNAALYRNRRQ
jgi:membrane protein